MRDDELDTLLLQAKPEPTALAVRAARHLGASVGGNHGTSATGSRTSKRRRWMALPVVGIGVFALTAAGSLTAYELHIPPFIEVQSGDARTAKVPIDFVTHDGTPVHCGAYLDYHRLSKTQVKQLNSFVTDTNWTSFGQQHYNALPLKTRTGKGQGANSAASNSLRDVVTLAQEHVPGLGYLAADNASISASMYTCTYPNGAPK